MLDPQLHSAIEIPGYPAHKSAGRNYARFERVSLSTEIEFTIGHILLKYLFPPDQEIKTKELLKSLHISMLKSPLGSSFSNRYSEPYQNLGLFQPQTCPARLPVTMMGHPDANVEHPRGQNLSPLSCTLSTVSEATNMEELRSFTNLPNLVVVNFNAQWCNPCRFMRDKFAVIANQYADHSVITVQVDIDRVPRAHQVYGVRTVPTFQLYRGGVRVGEVFGSNDGLLRSSILQNL
ncbi:hypothetical protein TWF569_007999 [Orbilia oligospora]|nr:hypothetical protein TWF103_010226 [Orbilia oligospora]KAF3155959.1 hypothetical protein TWF569_007999 [Orbilia oligospora]